MTRYLQTLLAAAAALTALGAFGASGAQAAEFHCSVEPCRFAMNPDGTGKTAHHVLTLENKTTSETVSFTCQQFEGEATTNTATSGELRLSNLAYQECRAWGTVGITFDMNGCDYLITGGGQLTIDCPAGQAIETQSVTGCLLTIGPQGPLGGFNYHNIGTAPNREITTSLDLHGIAVQLHGSKAECLIDPNQELEITYTTGNSILTAESHAGVMVDGWWE